MYTLNGFGIVGPPLDVYFKSPKQKHWRATDLTSSSESKPFELLINIQSYLKAHQRKLLHNTTGNVLMFSERVYANRKVCEYTCVIKQGHSAVAFLVLHPGDVISLLAGVSHSLEG